VAVTTGSGSPLERWAKGQGAEIFHIPERVPGRFSALTPVGLLPAAFLGIDLEGLSEGVQSAAARCLQPGPENPAFAGALLQCLLSHAGRRVLVLFPYAGSLVTLAEWFRQLWAESLGKEGLGQTPVVALGATDQHSQLQLYAQGTDQHSVLFWEVGKFAEELRVPSLTGLEEKAGYLSGHDLGQILRAEKRATEASLARSGRPCATIYLHEVTARSLGEVMATLMFQTWHAASLAGLRYDDQPGVEEGKRFTRAILGAEGHDKERRLLEEEARAAESDT
jgi:glucose-6-phosphate isomerase